ncbi:MAG: hypothetical protein Q9188_007404 [Gyalolechia gomerana]
MGKKRARELWAGSDSSEQPARVTRRRSARIQKLQELNISKGLTPSTSQNALHHDTSKPFPFLSLPPELRNKIYRHIVHFPTGVIKAPSMSPRLSLYLVSRQFHTEASKVFYTENVFHLQSDTAEKGQDPFGPALHRAQRCVLNLRLTAPFEWDFIEWYLTAFVAALSPKHELQSLLIIATPYQVERFMPLEKLSGVDLAQIDVAPPYYEYWFRGSPKTGWTWFLPYDMPKYPYQQHLERLMMSDGKSAEKIKEGLGKEYQVEPALTTALEGEELKHAKMCGGWPGTGELITLLNGDCRRDLRA